MGAPVVIKQRRRSPVGDALFHLTFVAVALANLTILSVRARSNDSLDEGATESWWSLALVVLWLLPAAFYLRTWAGEATQTQLWARAPVVQFVGILVASAGAVAALLRLLGVILVLLAQQGTPMTTEPGSVPVTVGMLHGQLVWETVDSIPILGITGALGWERPITDPSWQVGAAGVLGRIAVSVFLLWSFAYLVKRFRSSLLPRPGTDDDSGNTGDQG